MSNGKRSISAKERLVEMAAGGIFFAAITILALFTIVFQREHLFGKSIEQLIVFDNTGGLSAGDKVLLRGMEAGKVTKVDLAPDGQAINVTVSLYQPLEFYNDYVCEIRSSSMLGGQHIYLEIGHANTGVTTDNPLKGKSPTDAFAAIARLGGKMELAVDDFRTFAKDVREGDGTLHKLIYEDELYEEVRTTFKTLDASGVKAGEAMDSLKGAGDEVKTQLSTAKDAVESLKQAGVKVDEAATSAKAMTDNLNAAITEAREGKGTIGKLLTDDALYNDAKSMVADLSKAAERLNNEDSSLSKVMSDNGELYASIKGSFDTMESTMKSANEIVDSVKDGNGTLGKLVKDDKLYDDARATIKEVQGAVMDFREQAPILTFGSFIFGAL